MESGAARAISSRGPLRKEILPRPKIPQYKKALYNDTLTNTRLFHNCHVWNALNEATKSALETEHLKGYRLATGHETKNHANQHISNIQVLAKANRPEADAYLGITSGSETYRG